MAEKEDRRWCVYVHTNKINGKKYVGITSMKPEDRWNYGFGYQNSPHFWNAINLYGWDNFEHKILLTKLTKEEACCKEKELIAFYDTTNQLNGYNMSAGGGAPCVQWTDERRASMSKRMKGREVSEETRRKISESHIGKTQSEETKQKLREINLGSNNPNYGLKRSDETKRKMRDAMRGKSKKYKDPNGNPLKILICQYDKSGNLLNKFLGTYEASQETGVGRSSISNCLCGLSRTAGGYIWKHDGDPLTQNEIELANMRVTRKIKNGKQLEEKE